VSAASLSVGDRDEAELPRHGAAVRLGSIRAVVAERAATSEDATVCTVTGARPSERERPPLR
jgi:hypothetical protein